MITSTLGLDVLTILKSVIEEAGFYGDLVSKSDEINVIQKTIVQNIYTNDVVDGIPIDALSHCGPRNPRDTGPRRGTRKFRWLDAIPLLSRPTHISRAA